jgi:hypothetical protein
MRLVIAILMMLLTPMRATLFAGVEGRKSVLIVLRQPEGLARKRLASSPPTMLVPGEVQAVAGQERIFWLRRNGSRSTCGFAAIGASGVLHYPGLNMPRVEIPVGMVSSVESDSAVLSLTRLSGDAAGAAIGKPGHSSGAIQSPLPMLATGAVYEALGQGFFSVQSALPMQSGPGMGHRSGVFQPTLATGQVHGASPAFMPMQGPPEAMGGSFGAQPPGVSGGRTMFQSLLGVTSRI